MQWLLLLLLIGWLLLSACSRLYYGAMEKLGYHKRDLLVREVEAAHKAQLEVKAQFESALERFSALTHFEGGDLEALYRELKATFEESRVKAEEIHRRIAAIEEVATALFREWERELDQYRSERLRAKSAAKLEETKRGCGRLIEAMKRAESRTEPVLALFSDQVLFLKHNLNAQAVASLRGEVVHIEDERGADPRDGAGDR